MVSADKNTALRSLANAFEREPWFNGVRSTYVRGRAMLVLMALERPERPPTEWRGYPVLLEIHSQPIRSAV